MCSGFVPPAKMNVDSPAELWHLPLDDDGDVSSQPTDEEINAMRRHLQELNRKADEAKKAKQQFDNG